MDPLWKIEGFTFDPEETMKIEQGYNMHKWQESIATHDPQNRILTWFDRYEDWSIHYRMKVLVTTRKMNQKDLRNKNYLLKTLIWLILLRLDLYIDEVKWDHKAHDNIKDWGFRLVWIVRLMIYWSEKWSIPKVTKYERY